MLKKGPGSHGWFGKYLSLALMLPAAVAGGYFIGAGLDSALHKDYFKPVCILLGMGGGIAQVIKELSRDMDR